MHMRACMCVCLCVWRGTRHFDVEAAASLWWVWPVPCLLEGGAVCHVTGTWDCSVFREPTAVHWLPSVRGPLWLGAEVWEQVERNGVHSPLACNWA